MCVFVSACVFVFVSLFVWLFVSFFVFLFFCLFVCLFVCQSALHAHMEACASPQVIESSVGTKAKVLRP